MSKRPSRKPAASEPVPMKFILPVAGIVLLRLITAIFPGSALWGLDFVRYLSLPLMIGISALSLLVALDRLGKLQKLVDTVAAFLFPESLARRILIFGALSLACMAVFSVLTLPYPFLGDGKHVATTLFRILKGDSAAQQALWNEPLTHLYYLAAFKIFFPETISQAGSNMKGLFAVFQWTSYIIGGVYVFCVLLLSGKPVRKPSERLALVSGILGSGGMLLYFGYLEYYAFLYFFGTLFMLVALGEIKQRKSPLASGVLLALAIAFHLSAVVFIPAYIYLLVDYRRQSAGKPAFEDSAILKIVGIVLALCAAFYIGLNFAGVQGFFIPMFPGEVPWALLSVQHALDIVNNVFVHAPFAVAVFVAWFMSRQEGEAVSRELQFASIAAIFWFALIVSHSAIARDWDVYALFGVAFSVAAFYHVARMPQAVVRRYYYRQMALQPLLLLLPWIMVNANAKTAVQKALDFTHHYEEILPVAVSAGCYETIREFNADIGNVEGEIIMLQKIIELQPDPYQYYKLSRAVTKKDRHNEWELAVIDGSMNNILAIPEAQRNDPLGDSGHARISTLNDVYLALMVARLQSTETEPEAWLSDAVDRLLASGGNAFRPGMIAGKVFAGKGNHSEAMAWFQRALADTASADVEGDYTVPKLLSAIGVSQMGTGENTAAIDYFRRAANHPNTDPQVVSDYGFACYLMKQYEESEQAFRRVLKVSPTEKNALYCLGKMAIAQPDKRSEGRRLLRAYLRLYPGGSTAREIQSILASPPEGLSSLQP